MSAIDLGYIVGSIGLGQMAQSLGFAAMYLVSAGLMAFFMLVYWISQIKALRLKKEATVVTSSALAPKSSRP